MTTTTTPTTPTLAEIHQSLMTVIWGDQPIGHGPSGLSECAIHWARTLGATIDPKETLRAGEWFVMATFPDNSISTITGLPDSIEGSGVHDPRMSTAA